MKRRAAGLAWMVAVGAAHGLGCGGSSSRGTADAASEGQAPEADAGESSTGFDAGEAATEASVRPQEGGIEASAPSQDGGIEAGALPNATTYFATVLKLQTSCTSASCLCLPQVLPTDSAGQIACSILFALAAGDTCAAHGLSPAGADVVASLESLGLSMSFQVICILPQLPATETANGSCAGSSGPGWCYLTGSAAGTCSQTIVASGWPPAPAVSVSVCGSTPASAPPQGTSSAPVGAACTPSQELSASFAGFQFREVTLDEDNAACGGDVCLVNHFQGLTSCPYGQEQDGGPAPGGSAACTVPGTGAPVTPNSPRASEQVVAQCRERQPNSTVYCSCRCANAAGKTDDGATYCTCPAGYSCTPVVPAAFSGDPRAGEYCVMTGTAYDPNSACTSCSPLTNKCP